MGEISEKDGIQVELLIGANCVRALEPINPYRAKREVHMLTRRCLDGVLLVQWV